MALTDQERSFMAAAREQGYGDDEIVAQVKARRAKTPVAPATTEPVADPSTGQVIGEAPLPTTENTGAGVQAGWDVAAHPLATLTDPSKRREIERGVSNTATFGLAEKAANWADPSFAATAETDKAKAPGYRGVGETMALTLPNAASGVAGKAVQGAMKVGAKVVTNPSVIQGVAHVALDSVPHLAAHALGLGGAGHGVATAADFAIEKLHLPQKVAGVMGDLIARAKVEKWPSSKLAQAIVGLTQAGVTGAEASQ